MTNNYILQIENNKYYIGKKYDEHVYSINNKR